MDDKFLRFIYVFFLGLIVALFVGMGISTFYPAPDMPEYPHSMTPMSTPMDGSKIPEEDLQLQRQYEEAYKKYDEASQVHHRNVSIIALIFAVALVLISTLAMKRNNHVIMNGVMLGGVFVLIYSIGRGIASSDTKYTFIAVCVSLIVVLYLGYRRFNNAAPVAIKEAIKKPKRYP